MTPLMQSVSIAVWHFSARNLGYQRHVAAMCPSDPLSRQFEHAKTTWPCDQPTDYYLRLAPTRSTLHPMPMR